MYTLVGVNGNAYAIMGYVMQAMRECGKTPVEVKAYQDKAMSGDYNSLIVVSMDVIEDLNMLMGAIDKNNYEQ